MPLMVIVPDVELPEKLADTPAGKPLAPETPSLAMPVAPVVAWVMLGLKAVLMHSVGVEEAGPAVLFGLTVMVPVALTVPQPPVNSML